ncbi:tonoplast intrinsic protein 5;1 [Actinidia rufa]|uniref:Tonoplast intrinsic protein 51 n=1 Tax=Actinidia rufa TaxID=165716 RepID=A0A7J0F2A1_9ERIC|nr:tonoplast intrinsic protein 5;1 [Actinidia rufa]
MASLTCRLEHSVKPDALRSYLAEFISAFFFVFAAVGSAMASRKMVPDAATDPSTLVAIAIANAFALSVAVYISANISGGHVNPAVTFGMVHVPTNEISQEMTGFGASVLEGVMTFALVYTFYAARDPRHGPFGAIGPLTIGFIVGANVLASGPFTGGSMNPACSFGSALVGGSFKNQAVYWVGPLIGAALAGTLYDHVVFPGQMPGLADRGGF